MHRYRLAHAALALTSVLAVSSAAHAGSGTSLAVDLDVTNGIHEPGVSAGQGAALRLGYRMDGIVFSLTPELGLGYHRFGGVADARLTQGFVGGRLRFGKILEPGVYTHFGYGSLSSAGSGGLTGVSADVGGLLDFTLLPVLEVGAHAGYNGVLANSSHAAFDSYVLGLHAALVF